MLSGEGVGVGMALTACSTALRGNPISIRERTVGVGGGREGCCLSPLPPPPALRPTPRRRRLKSRELTDLGAGAECACALTCSAGSSASWLDLQQSTQDTFIWM